MTVLDLGSAEVLAAAAHRKAIWPSAVVGMDYTNRELSQALVVEGTRSLVERGLVQVDGGQLAVDSRFGEILDFVFASDPVVSAFIGTSADVAEVAGGAIHVYRAGEECVAEVVRATGQRELLVVDRSVAVMLLRTFVESVHRSPAVDGHYSGPVLYVGAPVGPGLPLTVVWPGRVRHGRGPDGHGPISGAVDVDVRDDGWVSRLLEGEEPFH